MSFRALPNWFFKFLFAERRAQPLLILRILFAFAVLLCDLGFLYKAEYFFGLDAISIEFPTSSILRLPINSLFVFYTIMAASGLSAIAILAGFFARPACLIIFVLSTIVYRHNPMIHFGVDSLLRFLSLLFTFAPLSSLSIRKIWQSRPSDCCPAWCYRFIQLQFSLIYLGTSYTKSFSEEWVSGTALHYFLHQKTSYRLVDWHLYDFFAITQPLTYLILGTELILGILIWIPSMMPLFILLGGALHLAMLTQTSIFPWHEIFFMFFWYFYQDYKMEIKPRTSGIS
jgi:hypothetical protein